MKWMDDLQNGLIIFSFPTELRDNMCNIEEKINAIFRKVSSINSIEWSHNLLLYLDCIRTVTGYGEDPKIRE